MEPATIPRVASLDLSPPSRSSHSCSPRVGLDEITRMPMFSWSGNKAVETTLPEYPISSPMASSFRSSFSQESTANSSSTISTGPPTPRTPKATCEVDDIIQADWSCIPATHMPRSLKRKSEPLEDEDVKRVKLPGLQHLLETPEGTQSYHNAVSKPKRHLQTPMSSPEPKSEYTFSRRPSLLPGEDPITKTLNLLRKEKNHTKDFLPRIGLSEPLHIPVDFANQLHESEQKWPSQTFDYCHQSPQQPSPPEEKPKKKRAGSKEPPHCNIKYSQEERDFLRYYNKDLKYSWKEITHFFGARFPMAEEFRRRRVQGVQGVSYRDNQHIPDIVPRRNQLVFLPNGHVATTSKKVRKQGNDRRRFGLVYLYPERAMKYDWVREEDRQLAAEINRERIPQRAQARRDAIKRGVWVEKFDNGECACCPRDEGERYKNKNRIAPETRSLRDSLEWLKLAR
ncbi:hypothetical protein F4809DRAFT_541783 [Biscogniauxia mediterranea]|nr:hypothetical protein F4809DRAFT_541783 [Biscogniauxia mediterranea]